MRSFRTLLWKKWCVYLDDILIYTKSMEEHCHITHLVLVWLHEHKLFLQHDKCKLNTLVSESHRDQLQWIQSKLWELQSSQYQKQRRRYNHSLGLWTSIVSSLKDFRIMHNHCSTSPRRMSHGPGVIVNKSHSMNWRIASLYPQYCNLLMTPYSFILKQIAQISQLVQCCCRNPWRMISGTQSHSTPITEWCRVELWDTWQGDACDHSCTGGVAPFPGGVKAQVQHLDGP